METSGAHVMDQSAPNRFPIYPRTPGVYDELVDQHGMVRPHWSRLLRGIDAMGCQVRRNRAEQINRRVRDVGIAHDIFSDPYDSDQGWSLDLLPFVISAQEWRWLEAALTQRARLFNTILADIYGDQESMRTGIIPPLLVHADPSFLPACEGIAPKNGHLQFFAADLARDADGQWRVIDSHAETMAGLGFALANRTVHAHFVNELLSDCGAMRLASYFMLLQDGLKARAGRPDPQIAILTPGPHHEDYFSHAYLARYLGHLLVEGGDIRVVEGRLFLKTLIGLRPIDLVVRCIEAGSADPLELNPTGFDGPVGLLQACRRNADLVVNGLGAAIVENRGLGAYLPTICQKLLGEPLMLQDSPRWWLGDPQSRRHVMQTPANWVIRPAHEGMGRPGRASVGIEVESDGSSRSIERLKTMINGLAETMVAEEHLRFATTPSLKHGELTPVASVVRFFVALTDEGYIAMPGGLSMSVDEAAAVSLSAASAEVRDVWVLSDEHTPTHTSLWRPTLEAARTDRSQRALQSRVADNLFWLGRYAERADWTMRVLRGAVRRLSKEEDADASSLLAARTCLARLVARGAPDLLPPYDCDDSIAVQQLVQCLLTQDGSDFGLPQTVQSLHRTVSLIRDRLSLEGWQTLSAQSLDGLWTNDVNYPSLAALQCYLDDGLSRIAAFNGLMHENMTRNFGWSFLEMGRRLERAHNISDAILGLFPQETADQHEASALLLLLELADSFITYRSRYRLDPMLHLVLDLLMLDETNPRSIAFQLEAISSHLESLPQAREGSELPKERRLILSLRTSVQLFDTESLAAGKSRARLHKILCELLEQLPRLSDAITHRYFNLSEDAPHRAIMRREFKK